MDERTIRTYDQMAAQYDAETTDFWERFPSGFLDRFASSIGSGLVLDVGCGPGRDGILLQQAGLNVIGLDASASMIRMSRDRGIPAIQGSFLNIPLANETVDGVWAYTSLLHVPKVELPNALREIRRVTRSGGILALGMQAGTQEGFRTSSEINLQRYFAEYNPDELAAVL